MDTIDTTRAQKLYPDFKGDVADYQPILESFGNIVHQFDSEGTDGDTCVLIRKGRKYGILVFGWGSCGGCDALQGCYTYEDIEELIVRMEGEIKWFGSMKQVKDYIIKEDRMLNHYYGYTTFQSLKHAILGTNDG